MNLRYLISIFFLVFFIYSCNTGDMDVSIQPESKIKTELNINVSPGSPPSGSIVGGANDEGASVNDEIHTLDIFVFKADTRKIDKYLHLDGSVMGTTSVVKTAHVECKSSGERDVFVVANAKKNLSKVLTETELKKINFDFISNDKLIQQKDNLSMYAYTSTNLKGGVNSINLSLKRHVAKISITWNKGVPNVNNGWTKIEKGSFAGASFKVKKVILLNSPSICNIAGSNVDVKSYYYGSYDTKLQGGIIYPNSIKTDELAFTTDSNKSIDFYTYPNVAVGNKNPTTVVLIADYKDSDASAPYTTCYPIVVNGAKASGRNINHNGIEANKQCFITATITGFGSANPWTPVKNINVGVTLFDWNKVKLLKNMGERYKPILEYEVTTDAADVTTGIFDLTRNGEKILWEADGDTTSYTVSNNTTGQLREHTYKKKGTYTVKVYREGATISGYLGGGSSDPDDVLLIFEGDRHCRIKLMALNDYSINVTNVAKIGTLTIGLYKSNCDIEIGSPNLFKGIPNVEDMSKLFASYSRNYYSGVGEHLKGSIPAHLFDNNNKLKNIEFMFDGCTGLTSISTKLFDNNKSIEKVGCMFRGCTGLTSIPADLFGNNTSIINMENMFDGCTSLTSISKDLFGNMDMSKVNHSNVFSRVTGVPQEVKDKLKIPYRP